VPETRAFVGPDTPAAQALCNTSAALQRPAPCNAQPCAPASVTSFPFVSFASVLAGADTSAVTLGSGEGWGAADAYTLAGVADGSSDATAHANGSYSAAVLAVQANREQLRANVSAALQAAIASLLSTGSVNLSPAAAAWLRNVSAADVLLQEPLAAVSSQVRCRDSAGQAADACPDRDSLEPKGWSVPLRLLCRDSTAACVSLSRYRILPSPPWCVRVCRGL
jgi:hypothetical protein